MVLFIIFVCLFATFVGSICGMGGGIIIKPMLDAFSGMDAATVSFLSSCTVLGMSAYSVFENIISKKQTIRPKSTLPLALGAAIGGVIGKELFLLVKRNLSYTIAVGRIQALCMLVLTLACLVYSFVRTHCKSLSLTNVVIIALTGLFLGLLSAFLGIGGGPINVTILFLLFSMNSKEAAGNSLYIVLFCQLFSLLYTISSRQAPIFEFSTLFFMVTSGIIGSILGRLLNRKLTNHMVDILFRCTMIFIILVNIYNLI